MRKVLIVLLTIILCFAFTFTVSAASNNQNTQDTFGKTLIICAVIGIVIGLITVLVLKGQLKSVRMQNQANNYMIPGSMRLTHSADIFLYRNVTRVAKPQNNNSGGGK